MKKIFVTMTTLLLVISAQANEFNTFSCADTLSKIAVATGKEKLVQKYPTNNFIVNFGKLIISEDIISAQFSGIGADATSYTFCGLANNESGNRVSSSLSVQVYVKSGTCEIIKTFPAKDEFPSRPGISAVLSTLDQCY